MGSSDAVAMAPVSFDHSPSSNRAVRNFFDSIFDSALGRYLSQPGQLLRDHLPAIQGAVVLTTRGGDFDLHVGQDISIGYLSHTDSVVRLYLQETLTFLLLTTEASVSLLPPTPAV